MPTSRFASRAIASPRRPARVTAALPLAFLGSLLVVPVRANAAPPGETRTIAVGSRLRDRPLFEEGSRALDVLPAGTAVYVTDLRCGFAKVAVGTPAGAEPDDGTPTGATADNELEGWVAAYLLEPRHSGDRIATLEGEPVTVADALDGLTSGEGERADRATRAVRAAGARARAGLVEALAEGEAPRRRAAAWALGVLGETGRPAAPALAEVATAPCEKVALRQRAVEALAEVVRGRDGGDAAAHAAETLTTLLDDPAAAVRASAARGLGSLEVAAGERAASALVDRLDDPSPDVREAAVFALGEIGDVPDHVIPALVRATGYGYRASTRTAQAALVELGDRALPATLAALGADPSDHVRSSAAHVLGKIAPNAVRPGRIEALTAALEDPSRWVRSSAAGALAALGAQSRPAIPALVARITDPAPLDPDNPWDAASALAAVAASSADRADAGELGASELTRLAAELEAAERALTGAAVDHPEARSTLRAARERIERARDGRVLGRLAQMRRQLTAISPLLAALVLAGLGYLALVAVIVPLAWIASRVSPLALLAFDARLARLSVDVPYLGTLSPSRALGVRQLALSAPVLDAWVARHLDGARRGFALRPTVAERQVHVPLPVMLDGVAIASPRAADLRPAFSGRSARLLVTGTGGAGKTDLAVELARTATSADPMRRLARHAMIPLLIEDERGLEAAPDLVAYLTTLLATICDAPLEHPALARALLARGRVLVVLDHWSEMSEAARTVARPLVAGDAAAMVVVTGRTGRPFGDLSHHHLEPLPIAGEHVASVLAAHLDRIARQRPVADAAPGGAVPGGADRVSGRDVPAGSAMAPDDPAFFEACAGLSRLVGDRPVTPLFARLYAEILSAPAEPGEPAGVTLPTQVPDLVLAYVRWVGRRASDGAPAPGEAEQLLGTIAGCGLGPGLVPGPAALVDVATRAGLEPGDVAGQVARLAERTSLVRFEGFGATHARVTLDPIAEYLAALDLLAREGTDAERWRSWVDETAARAPRGAASPARPFLEALADCITYKSALIGVVPGARGDVLSMLEGS